MTLPYDLGAVAESMELGNAEISHYLDTATGEIHVVTDPGITGIEIEIDTNDPRYVLIPTRDSRSGYEDMDEFAATVKDPRLREKLFEALEGARPFRRFKDVLSDYPDEPQAWFAFSRQCVEAEARRWLAEIGYGEGKQDG